MSYFSPTVKHKAVGNSIHSQCHLKFDRKRAKYTIPNNKRTSVWGCLATDLNVYAVPTSTHALSMVSMTVLPDSGRTLHDQAE